MNDPCDVLGLTPDAEPADVRARYLQLVRQHSPERDPDKFAEIQAAYERMRDPEVRLTELIFESSHHDSLDDVIGVVRARLREARIPVEILMSMGDD